MVHSRITVAVTVVLLTALAIGLISSCSIYYKIVPYKTFSSINPYLDFTFDYPSELSESIQNIKVPDSPNGITEMTLKSSSSTIYINVLDVTSDITALSLYQDIPSQVKSWEESFDFIDNLEVLKQDTIMLDGVSGYDFEMKYDDKQKSALIGNNFRAYDRMIDVQRNDRIYGLRFFVKASETDTIKQFQHLLDTWKWK